LRQVVEGAMRQSGIYLNLLCLFALSLDA